MKTRFKFLKSMKHLTIAVFTAIVLGLSAGSLSAGTTPTAGFRLNDNLYVCQGEYCEQIDGASGRGEVFYTGNKQIAGAWNFEANRAYLCTADYLCRIRKAKSNGKSEWDSDWGSLHGNSTWEAGPLSNGRPLTAAWNGTKYNYGLVFIAQETEYWVWNVDHWVGPTTFKGTALWDNANVEKVYAAYNDGYKSDFDAVYLHISANRQNRIVIWNNHSNAWVEDCKPCHLLGLGTNYFIGNNIMMYDTNPILVRRTDQATKTVNGVLWCHYRGNEYIMEDEVSFTFTNGDMVYHPENYSTCGGRAPNGDASGLIIVDGVRSDYFAWL